MKRKIMHYNESRKIYRVSSSFWGKFLEYILKAVLVKKEDMQICQSLHRF